jgi:hypothetical protein
MQVNYEITGFPPAARWLGQQLGKRPNYIDTAH